MNRRLFLGACGGACGAFSLWSQTAPIQVDQLSDGIYMLSGDGGNIGVATGDNAVMIVDGGYANRAEEMLKTIADHVDSDQVKILFNTHHHADHTGCNEALRAARGTKILAHENVAKRLSPQLKPTETFAAGGKIDFGPLQAEYMHVPTAHTDGDSYIFFPEPNVLHCGDLFFNGFYPVIDTAAGGWLGGMEAAARALLEVGDGDTQVIPGHGPLATKTELKETADMLSAVHDRLTKLAKQGRSLQEAMADLPLKDLDAKWGMGPVKPEAFLRPAYSGILQRR